MKSLKIFAILNRYCFLIHKSRSDSGNIKRENNVNEEKSAGLIIKSPLGGFK